MIPEKDLDLITRFFDLDLSHEELKEFEKRILLDIKFRERCEAFKAANDIVNTTYPDKDKKTRTEKWKPLLNDKETTIATKKTPWKWIAAIAAGFVITFFIWQLNSTFQEPNLNKLIASSWSKKIGLDFNTIRSTKKDSLKSLVSIAYNTYSDMNYQSTINLLSDYKADTIYYEDVLLLRALSFYKKEESDIALKTLDTLSKYHTGKKSKVANWYKGLIYLEQGDIETAKKFVELPKNKTEELKLRE